MYNRQVAIYTYEELDDRAKEKAREWYSSLVFEDSCDWEFVYDDAVRIANLLGINIDQRSTRLLGGGSGSRPIIYFSGFWSQGDGACFEGSYRYAKGAVAAIKKETGCGYVDKDGVVHEGDKELIRIATELQDIQRRHFYKLQATMKHRGHYSHSGCMEVEVFHDDDRYRDIGDAEDEICQLMRDFADWIYDRLEAEYDYQTSDEAVEEAIVANEYEFLEDGSRA